MNFYLAYVTFINVLVQHVQTMHRCVLAHALNLCKAQVRLHQVGAASWVMKDVTSSSELHLSSHSQDLLLPRTGQTRQSQPTNPFSLFNRGHLQQVISRGCGSQAGLHQHWSWVAEWRGASGQAGPSVWQLLRDSTCQRGLNRSQLKRQGCRMEWLTPGIPTPGFLFLSSPLAP